jgi:hypothetical protein
MIQKLHIIFNKNSTRIVFIFLNVIIFNHVSAQVNKEKITSKTSIVGENNSKGFSKNKETVKYDENNKNHQNDKENPKKEGNQPTLAPQKNKSIEPSDNSSKTHFILNLNVGAKNKQELYNHALNSFTRLENYRLLDKRRTIQLANGDGSVELFSANELKQLYGRLVRPQNKNDIQVSQEIELVLSEQGIIKEQLKK